MSVMRKALRVCWDAIPIRYRAQVKEVGDVVKLDYPRHDIYMHVASRVDIGRSGACEKEPGTIEWIERNVEGVFYDIGANVGAYSLVAWAHSAGRTRVVAFEPGVSTFSQLCRNLVLNGCGDTVTPLNVALSDVSGLRHFQYRRLEGGAASHVGLNDVAIDASPRARQIAFSQPMWVHTLDEVVDKFRLPPPNHIKIDVDGHELAVLRGARATLGATSLRSLQIEVTDRDKDSEPICEILQSHGFVVDRVSAHARGRTTDYVFMRAHGA